MNRSMGTRFAREKRRAVCRSLDSEGKERVGKRREGGRSRLNIWKERTDNGSIRVPSHCTRSRVKIGVKRRVGKGRAVEQSGIC
jgi:hypothetical protein